MRPVTVQTIFVGRMGVILFFFKSQYYCSVSCTGDMNVAVINLLTLKCCYSAGVKR